MFSTAGATVLYLIMPTMCFMAVGVKSPISTAFLAPAVSRFVKLCRAARLSFWLLSPLALLLFSTPPQLLIGK